MMGFDGGNSTDTPLVPQRRGTPTKKFTQRCGWSPRQPPTHRPHPPKNPGKAQPRRSPRSRRSSTSAPEVPTGAGGAPCPTTPPSGGALARLTEGVGGQELLQASPPQSFPPGESLPSPHTTRGLGWGQAPLTPLFSQSGWCTRSGRSAGTSKVSVGLVLHPGHGLGWGSVPPCLGFSGQRGTEGCGDSSRKQGQACPTPLSLAGSRDSSCEVAVAHPGWWQGSPGHCLGLVGVWGVGLKGSGSPACCSQRWSPALV